VQAKSSPEAFSFSIAKAHLSEGKGVRRFFGLLRRQNGLRRAQWRVARISCQCLKIYVGYEDLWARRISRAVSQKKAGASSIAVIFGKNVTVAAAAATGTFSASRVDVDAGANAVVFIVVLDGIFIAANVDSVDERIVNVIYRDGVAVGIAVNWVTDHCDGKLGGGDTVAVNGDIVTRDNKYSSGLCSGVIG
jgi:hypothetical protein